MSGCESIVQDHLYQTDAFRSRISPGPIRRHISTVGLHPVNLDSVTFATRLGAQRVCGIGQMQNPPLTWHHDGWPTLASLVRYVDVEGLGTNPRGASERSDTGWKPMLL